MKVEDDKVMKFKIILELFLSNLEKELKHQAVVAYLLTETKLPFRFDWLGQRNRIKSGKFETNEEANKSKKLLELDGLEKAEIKRRYRYAKKMEFIEDILTKDTKERIIQNKKKIGEGLKNEEKDTAFEQIIMNINVGFSNWVRLSFLCSSALAFLEHRKKTGPENQCDKKTQRKLGKKAHFSRHFGKSEPS